MIKFCITLNMFQDLNINIKVLENNKDNILKCANKIENGELTTPIRNSGMSGMTLEVLQNTLGVGNDLMIDAFPGVCGKGNLTGFQPMPVTGGGPTIAAKDIIVGGK